ncbi:MAG: Protein YrdA [Candidatus Omnitrophica bacterium]|nr:Protein YrdA [Candidatus Omnitrophota bacterium]
MILPFGKLAPRVHRTAFVAPGASVVGDVRLAKDSSVWFGAVLRGDMGGIVIGEGSNVQDGCVLHGDHGKGVRLGRRVTMGHQAVAHACVIEDGCLIGIGAKVLTGARVGHHSLIAAGALVKEGQVVPPYSLVVGMPGRVVRRLSAVEVRRRMDGAERYVRLAARYRTWLG